MPSSSAPDAGPAHQHEYVSHDSPLKYSHLSTDAKGDSKAHDIQVTTPRVSLTRMTAPLSTNRIVTDIVLEPTHEQTELEPQVILKKTRENLTRMEAPVAEGTLRDTASAQSKMTQALYAHARSPGKTSLYSPRVASRPTEADVRATIAAKLAPVKAAGYASDAAVNAKKAQMQDEQNPVANSCAAGRADIVDTVTRKTRATVPTLHVNRHIEAAAAKRVNMTQISPANTDKHRKMAEESRVAGGRSPTMLPLVMLMIGVAIGWVLRGAGNSVDASC